MIIINSDGVGRKKVVWCILGKQELVESEDLSEVPQVLLFFLFLPMVETMSFLIKIYQVLSWCFSVILVVPIMI